MSAVLASLIAVAGTLLGSLSTYLFQRRTAQQTATAARAERIRQEQLTACGGFATALTELKRGVITSWFMFHRDSEFDERNAALTDSDRLGAAAEAARFRMLLVTDNTQLRELAEAAFTRLGRVGEASDRQELKEREREFEAAVLTFVAAAGNLLRHDRM